MRPPGKHYKIGTRERRSGKIMQPLHTQNVKTAEHRYDRLMTGNITVISNSQMKTLDAQSELLKRLARTNLTGLPAAT
jgi:hypothetical protein